MDIILPNHTPSLLEDTFDSTYLYDHPLFSVMAQSTELPWLLIIPKQPLTDSSYIGALYQEIHQLIAHLKQAGFGPHFNLAKLGNQNPYLHIHIIFRDKHDEAWPNPIWCYDSLTPSQETLQHLKQVLKQFFTPPYA